MRVIFAFIVCLTLTSLVAPFPALRTAGLAGTAFAAEGTNQSSPPNNETQRRRQCEHERDTPTS